MHNLIGDIAKTDLNEIQMHNGASLVVLNQNYQANWELILVWVREIPIAGKDMQVNTLQTAALSVFSYKVCT